MIRRIVWLLAALTLMASGGYTFVYLYRWEWNRALFTSLVFIAVEVGVVAALLIRRFARIEARLDAEQERIAAEARAKIRLAETAPKRDHFAWLQRSTQRTNVFITILLGAGVLISALTWVVDKLASRTARPTLESGLAKRLGTVSFPDHPLVPEDEELVAQGGPYSNDPAIAVLLGPRR